MILRTAVACLVVSGIICAITGVLLSMYYVPLRDEVIDTSGMPLAISEATARPIVSARGDTLAGAGQRALVLRGSGQGTSYARASVEVSIHNAWGGEVLRGLHRAATLVCVLGAFVALAVLAWQRQWMVKSLWIASVSSTLLGVVLAWTGLQLPDGAYAWASHGVIVNAISDNMAFGGLIDVVGGIGIGSVQPLARMYALHALVMPLALAACLAVLWRRTAFTLRLIDVGIAAFGVVLFSVVAGAEPTGEMAWYPFRIASHLQSIFGTELGSYLATAWILAMFSMPWWHTYVRPITAVVIVLLGVAAVVFAAFIRV